MFGWVSIKDMFGWVCKTNQPKGNRRVGVAVGPVWIIVREGPRIQRADNP